MGPLPDRPEDLKQHEVSDSVPGLSLSLPRSHRGRSLQRRWSSLQRRHRQSSPLLHPGASLAWTHQQVLHLRWSLDKTDRHGETSLEFNFLKSTIELFQGRFLNKQRILQKKKKKKKKKS